METPAAPEKVRITPALIAEWTHDAGVLLDANCSDAEVVRDLRERGCTPRMAEMIVARAKAPVRARHRGYGLLALLIGGGMLLLGFVLYKYSGFAPHSGKGTLAALGLLIVGGMIALLGAYKVFSGSALDVETTVFGTADDELQGKTPIARSLMESVISPDDFGKRG